jgi:hypothetical protein
VLPHTWDWFRDDVARSKPVVFVKSESVPAAGTPFAELVATGFRLVYRGGQSVYLRNDIASAVLDVPAGAPWTSPDVPPSGSGWTLSTSSAVHHDRAVGGDGDVLLLARDNCFRIDGSVATGEDALPAFDVRFDDNPASRFDMKRERLHLKFSGDKASSSSDAVEYESASSGVDAASRGPVAFSLVVGRRAAALVVNGQIRAAMRISSSVKVSLAPLRSSLTLSDLRSGPVPPGSGC